MKTLVLCFSFLVLIGWGVSADAQRSAVGGMHSGSPGFDGRERGSAMSRPESGFGEEQREQFRQSPSERGEEFEEQGRQFERRGEQLERQDDFRRFPSERKEESEEQGRQSERRGEQFEQRDQFGRGGEFSSQNRGFGMSGEVSGGNEREFSREPFSEGRDETLGNRGFRTFERE